MSMKINDFTVIIKSCSNIIMYFVNLVEQFSGKNCEIDFDHCTNTGCANNGTCIDQKGSSICACASHSGYFGSR